MKLTVKRPQPGGSAVLPVKGAEPNTVVLDGGSGNVADRSSHVIWSVRGESIVCSTQQVSRKSYPVSSVGFSYVDRRKKKVVRGTASTK